MSKVTYYSRLGHQGAISDFFSDYGNLDLTLAKAGKAVFVDGETGNHIVLNGSGLQYDGDDLIAGTITSVSFETGKGKPFMTFEKGAWSAEEFSQIYANDHIWNLEEKLLLTGNDRIIGSKGADYMQSCAGNDKVFGGKGDDRIYGSLGNDQFTGGKGSDIFIFEFAFGKTVIKDFDATGGGQRQDYLLLVGENSDFDIVKSGHDVVLHFDSGGTLTLKDVPFNSFDHTDYSPFG
ncbi:MAG: hypothetical protein KDJ87_12545 [Rhizobiaceae bacterium]|nr:hypothetical protein [Rhizobiaceae bacterium]